MKDVLRVVAMLGVVAWLSAGAFYFLVPSGTGGILASLGEGAQTAATLAGFDSLLLRLIPGVHVPDEKTVSTLSSALQEISPKIRKKLPECSIAVEPTLVHEGGSARISWSTRNADHAVLEGVGGVALLGSMPIDKILSSRVLSMTVSSDAGSSACYAVVAVSALRQKKPKCEISVYPEQISLGEPVDLAWWSTGAERIVLEGEGDISLMGGRTIYPLETSSYELIVSSKEGDSRCSATVEVR